MTDNKSLEVIDEEVASLIAAEDGRQRNTIRLIASENYASAAVREATASRFTNKYSEGYPGRRYYQGQEFTDNVENLARDRACRLFGAEHANIQPYSGSPANLAVYYALLELGDPILGMGLPFGGHLTHGWKVSFSGRFYDAHHYELDPKTELIDYEEVRRKAKDVQPKLLIAGASAYPRLIDFKAFSEIASEVGAYFLADIAHISGLVAGGAHPSPFPYADVVTTTTHKTLRGPRGGLIMCREELASKIDRAVFPALQGGPHMNAVAAAAVAFQEASQPEFRDYAAQIVKNAKALATGLLEEGYRLVTGGTDNHLILMDLSSRDIGGKKAAQALEKAGVVVNSNSIPFDTRSPFDPSGIRIGTAAVTTRGMVEKDMKEIARFISAAIDCANEEDKLEHLASEVREFTSSFPLP